MHGRADSDDHASTERRRKEDRKAHGCKIGRKTAVSCPGRKGSDGLTLTR